MTAVSPVSSSTVFAGRRARARRAGAVTAMLALFVIGLFAASLMVGKTFYPLDDVLRVIGGQRVPGASFTVGELRLPRATTALLTGAAFGVAGVTFQSLLRNPLASPDIIGISWGASAAAVGAIVVLGLTGPAVSIAALIGALLTAGAVYGLSSSGGFAGTRLILIGIGLAAMLSSLVSYVLAKASQWDIASALRWLTGSLADASWSQVLPLASAMAVLLPVLIVNSRNLNVLTLGDDSAAGLGVRVNASRLVFVLGAVLLLAFATAAAGPISFVAFMSGPIAARLVGPGPSPLVPSALVGAALVLAADLIGQYALPHRYPVGVVTGVLGAPFLIYLLVRVNRAGSSM
ncbi:FecCD family ABC transporter permease [Gordonia neofelifaecis]|uniref:Enterobactin ABC transporter permease n=1 Tax=Gordonia neofelifaecis NRRL B-59395 TaxID=644548 RepID=F1YFL0_9ACTN|nr:iron ABC transporter permease [Gordonia neofelifaecis]EGD56394.1 enterobactin ABC transporter permease [Gordonia neofelifaecis NRRL B-59395]